MSEILHTFGIDWRLMLVQAVNFTVLLLVLWYFLYGPIVRTVKKRKAEIQQSIEDAREARRQREAIEQEREKQLAEARKQAEEIVNYAQQNAREQENQLIADAQQRSERIIAEAQKNAEHKKQEIIDSSKTDISRMAVLAAEKVLRERRSSSVHSHSGLTDQNE